ncbi:MAG: transposase [Acidimicrobiales bacterium]|nr:transposase [Acidimicrobiales bacterium]
MSVRRLIVEVDPKSLNVTQFCAEHGVSTWFFWDLRRRHDQRGQAVLEPGSRAPRTVANRTSAEIEEQVVRARKELFDTGWDCGPASIADHLDGLDGLPSEATIWRILHRHGLITPEPGKAPKPQKSFVAERANEVWALDDTESALADGTIVKILNVIDDHSRLAVVCVPMLTCTGAAAFAAMAHAAQILGWPQRFWSDNAKAFTLTLANAVAPLGVVASHTRPFSPNSNGKAERFHKTQAKWLAKQPSPQNLEHLTVLLEWFRLHYNQVRKHRGINRQTPASVWDQAAKTGPSTSSLGTTTSVHTSTVNSGRIDARDVRISLGAAHNGETTTTIITGTRAHVFINARLIRELEIDPTKRNQPLYNRAGQPKKTVREDPRHA